MTTMFLDHPLLLSLGLFVLLTAAVEGGFRLAVLTSPNIDEERREQIAASRDALGILLSLLLASPSRWLCLVSICANSW